MPTLPLSHHDLQDNDLASSQTDRSATAFFLMNTKLYLLVLAIAASLLLYYYYKKAVTKATSHQYSKLTPLNPLNDKLQHVQDQNRPLPFTLEKASTLPVYPSHHTLQPAPFPEPTIRRHSYPLNNVQLQTDHETVPILNNSRSGRRASERGGWRRDEISGINGCRRHVFVVEG